MQNEKTPAQQPPKQAPGMPLPKENEKQRSSKTPLESDFDTPHDIKPPKATMAGERHDDEDAANPDVDPREPAVKACGTDSCGCGTGKKPN